MVDNLRCIRITNFCVIKVKRMLFDRLCGFRSHSIAVKHLNQKIAVRVVSQFGEESTKVVGVGS